MHTMTLLSTRTGTPGAPDFKQTFVGVCSCGERSHPCPAAGMVHGWHGTHVDEANSLISV